MWAVEGIISTISFSSPYQKQRGCAVLLLDISESSEIDLSIWRLSKLPTFPLKLLILASQCQAANFFHYLKVHLADHTLSFMLPCCVCWCSRMSLQILNAENGENGGSIKDDLTAEDCGFFFVPPEPTGRPSILRLSQKENLPPKSVGKAMKVNLWFSIIFILSPSKISATECMCYLVLEKYCAPFFFSFPCFVLFRFDSC